MNTIQIWESSRSFTTVNDIVYNFLQRMQLFRIKAETTHALEPELLAKIDSVTQETVTKLQKLGDIDSTLEIQMANGPSINYD